MQNPNLKVHFRQPYLKSMITKKTRNFPHYRRVSKYNSKIQLHTKKGTYSPDFSLTNNQECVTIQESSELGNASIYQFR